MKEVFPCGDGTCSVTATGADCICSAGSFGDSCENFVCSSKSCGLNGQEFVAYTFSGIDYCQCDCNAGFSGSLCENVEETLWGKECLVDSECTAEGQICDSEVKQCRCDESSGYILNEFQAEITYGQCVGPVTACSENSDCSNFQNCVNGRCSCDDQFGELCLKDGEWQCVQDPLPDCVQGQSELFSSTFTPTLAGALYADPENRKFLRYILNSI